MQYYTINNRDFWEDTLVHQVLIAQQCKTAINEYPTQGIQAEIGGDGFVAWALQNTISEDQSYYVKVQGFPKKIMFGGHPGTDQAEVHVISLS